MAPVGREATGRVEEQGVGLAMGLGKEKAASPTKAAGRRAAGRWAAPQATPRAGSQAGSRAAGQEQSQHQEKEEEQVRLTQSGRISI